MTPEIERNTNDNPLGVYRHEEAGVELIATEVPQADALVRLGYKFVGTEADVKAEAEPKKATK